MNDRESLPVPDEVRAYYAIVETAPHSLARSEYSSRLGVDLRQRPVHVERVRLPPDRDFFPDPSDYLTSITDIEELELMLDGDTKPRSLEPTP